MNNINTVKQLLNDNCELYNYEGFLDTYHLEVSKQEFEYGDPINSLQYQNPCL